MRIGVFVSETWGAPSTVAQVAERARRAEADGFASVWVPYLPWAVDALTAAHAAGLATSRVEVGTAVVPTYLFHPLAMARQALTVDAAIGGRLTLGVGPSQPTVIEKMHGIPFHKPAAHTREYLRVLRAASAPDTATVEFAGDHFAIAAMFGVPQRRALPLLVGALGPLMLQAAGEHSDGTIATSSDEGAIERVIGPGIRNAAAAAGRPEPRVGAVIAVCVAAPRALDGAREAMAQHFATYERIPRYARMLALGDKSRMADVHVAGDEAHVRRRLSSFASAGLTDFIAAPFAFGADPEASRRPTLELLADVARRGA